MLLHEEPETHEDVITSSVADNQGNFNNTDFAPATADAGRSFTLTAIGQSSGFTAQTAFKDSPRIGAVTVGAQSGTLTFGTTGSVTFGVTLQRTQNGTVNGTMSIVGSLPTGSRHRFLLRLGLRMGVTHFRVTLTLSTNGTTPAGSYAFTVSAADGLDISTEVRELWP